MPKLRERLLAIIESRRMEPWTDTGRPCCVMCGSRWDGEHKAECWVPTLREAAALLAPQEARDDEASWVEYERRKARYTETLLSRHGVVPMRPRATSDDVTAAETALDVHVHAMAAPETERELLRKGGSTRGSKTPS